MVRIQLRPHRLPDDQRLHPPPLSKRPYEDEPPPERPGLSPGQMESLYNDQEWALRRRASIKDAVLGALIHCPSGAGATCQVNLDTKWQGGTFGEDWDHKIAIRSFNYRVSGNLPVTRLEGGQIRVTGKTRSDFQKSWNFDPKDDLMGVKFAIFTELHRQGITRNFEARGSVNGDIDMILN